MASTVLVAPTQAADLNEIKKDQRQVESSLALTNQALGKANTKLQKALTAVTAAQRKLEAAKLQKESAQQESEKAKAVAETARVESEYAKSALNLGTRALVRLNRQLENQRGDMEDLARAIYQQGPLSEVDILMSAQDPADFTARMVAINYVSREQQGMERTILASSADAMRQEVKLTALTEKALATQAQAERQKSKALQAFELAAEKQRTLVQVRKEKRQTVKSAKVFKIIQGGPTRSYNKGPGIPRSSKVCQ
jgi:septal ring factor EnvC (AmiA/AmiB activator)